VKKEYKTVKMTIEVFNIILANKKETSSYEV